MTHIRKEKLEISYDSAFFVKCLYMSDEFVEKKRKNSKELDVYNKH